MHVVDTNILVYAATDDGPEHGPCRRLVERWRGDSEPWYATWGVLYGFLRVTTHRGIGRRPWSAAQAWAFIEAMFQGTAFRILDATDAHRDLVTRCIQEVPSLAGNPWHDFHTAVLMREHGITRIYPRGTDFPRFPWVEVVDPLA